MSIEFACDVAEDGDFRSVIASALSDDCTFEVIPSPDASLVKMRFRANPTREQWPEDVEVSLVPGRIAVVVHSATRQQREYLVQLLERLLVEAGCPGKLAEQ
jgi:hypothetical protein